MDHHNLQSRGTKQQQRPQPNNHHDFFLRFTRLKDVLLVPVPLIITRTRRRTTSQQEQQAILVLVQQHVIHNHTQNRCRGDRRHLFYQIADNYVVIWVYILPPTNMSCCQVIIVVIVVVITTVTTRTTTT